MTSGTKGCGEVAAKIIAHLRIVKRLNTRIVFQVKLRTQSVMLRHEPRQFAFVLFGCGRGNRESQV